MIPLLLDITDVAFSCLSSYLIHPNVHLLKFCYGFEEKQDEAILALRGVPVCNIHNSQHEMLTWLAGYRKLLLQAMGRTSSVGKFRAVA